MSKAGRLEERPLRWLGVETHRGWDLKMYSITRPAQTLDEAALPAVREELARLEPASAPGATGVVVVHQGAEGLWLLVGCWVGDILHQSSFRSDLDAAPRFTRVPSGGPTVCVWELPVLSHERDAFVAHMLGSDPPRLVSYLADIAPGAIPRQGDPGTSTRDGRTSDGTRPDEQRSDIQWSEAKQLLEAAEKAFSSAGHGSTPKRDST